jgi:hypothetical protein
VAGHVEGVGRNVTHLGPATRSSVSAREHSPNT